IAKREAELIPGTLEATSLLRQHDVKIGSTTGYVRPIMEGVVERAAAQGFSADCLVCADEVPVGRPTAMAMYQCFVALGVHEPSRIVKVDDTAPGIAEGRAAGTWTIGLNLSGNAVGLTEQALNAFSEPEKQKHRERAGHLLNEAGADYVIDSIADIQEPLEAIGARIAAGEKPPIS
ncbi:MAG: HAD-IA family hydrolase, partial [Pseudomonadota bacterium]